MRSFTGITSFLTVLLTFSLTSLAADDSNAADTADASRKPKPKSLTLNFGEYFPLHNHILDCFETSGAT